MQQQNPFPETPREWQAQAGMNADRLPSRPTWEDLLTPLAKLTKDARMAARNMSQREARYLVDLYYGMQDQRIRDANQVRALSQSTEPHEGIAWVLGQSEALERAVASMLDQYSQHERTGMGAWAREIVGIGPVIAAGFVAYLDIEPPPTVGHWWRFAGLDSTNEWLGTEKAEKIVKTVVPHGKAISDEQIAEIATILGRNPARVMAQARWAGPKKPDLKEPTVDSTARALARRPWHAGLKTLCYKLGESFVKVQGHDRDIFGKVFVARKALEWRRNLNGEYAEQAREKLQKTKIGADTDAYVWYAGCLTPDAARAIRDLGAEAGAGAAKKAAGAPGSGVAMLPPAHIHARARRYAVKLWMSLYHAEAYRRYHKAEPPLPYAIAKLGHAHHLTMEVLEGVYARGAARVE